MLAVTLNARTLLLICGATGCWAFSFGLGSQVVTHWLKAHQVSDTVIGITHSFYYFGMAIGAFTVPRLSTRFGPSRCVLIGMIASGTTLGVFPLLGGEAWAYALRFLNGWAGALSVIPLEAIVSRDSAPESKTQNFGYYGLATVLGGSIGISSSLHLYEFSTALSFWIGSATPVVAALTLLPAIATQATPAAELGASASLGILRNFLSYGTAWSQGFIEGIMIAFLSLYIESLSYSKEISGDFVAIATIGTIVLMAPISWLGDRCGKTPILLGCYAVTALGLFGLPYLSEPIELGVTLFVFGACAGAMYPLGLALLTDRMPASGLARAYAWYLAIECVGCQAGAAAAGKARDIWGQAAMFPVGLTAVVGVLAIWAAMRLTGLDRRAGADFEKKNELRFAA